MFLDFQNYWGSFANKKILSYTIFELLGNSGQLDTGLPEGNILSGGERIK